VLTGPPPAGVDDSADYKAKFQLESFTCREEAGDGASGRDEIYWTVGARTDKYVAGSGQGPRCAIPEKPDQAAAQWKKIVRLAFPGRR
jgi:hypothetical protein